MMDNSVLTSLNVIPFLGLMNLLEVKYMHIPEVYRSVLAVLCDYNPLIQSNIVRTRRYLTVLLSREPDLAQCLLNFIDEPQDKTDASSCNRDEEDARSSENSDRPVGHAYPSPAANTVTVNTEFLPQSAGAPAKWSTAPGNGMFKPSDKISITQDSVNKARFDYGHDFTTSPHKVGSVSDTAVRQQQTAVERCSHFVPLINIQHRSSLAPSSHLDSSITTSCHQARHSSMAFPQMLSAAFPQTSHVTMTSTGITDSANILPNIWSTAQQSCVMGQLQASGSQRCSETHVALDTHAGSKCDQHHGTIAICTPHNTLANSISAAQNNNAGPATGGSTSSQSICLSKLLGQPGVAYFSTAHYMDNRNTIVGGGQRSDKNIYSCTLLDAKVPSASAKLRMLSTQVGSDKAISSTVLGKPSATVTTSLGSLSLHAAGLEKMESAGDSFSKQSEGTKPLSKILPLPKKGHEHRSEVSSSDKQVQAGERQLCRRPRILVDRRPQAQYTTLQPHSVSIAAQLTHGEDVHGAEDSGRNGVEWFQQQSESKPSGSKMEQRLKDECQGRKQGGEGTGKRVQVVEVAVGSSTSSHTTFPYIQQMVLPESQATAITHVTPCLNKSSWTGAKEVAKITCRPAISSQAGNPGRSKPTTQIILPRNQVKLSVSIQTCTTSSNFSKRLPTAISTPVKPTSSDSPPALSLALHSNSKGNSDVKDSFDLKGSSEIKGSSEVKDSLKGSSEIKGSSEVKDSSDFKGTSEVRGSSDDKGGSDPNGSSDVKGSSDLNDSSDVQDSSCHLKASSDLKITSKVEQPPSTIADEAPMSPPSQTSVREVLQVQLRGKRKRSASSTTRPAPKKLSKENIDPTTP